MDEAAGAQELKAIAAELEKAALLVRVAARAINAGSPHGAAVTLSEARSIINRYVSTDRPPSFVTALSPRGADAAG